MKKIAILLLFATALSTFTGCNTTSEQPADTSATTTATTTTDSSTVTPDNSSIHNVKLNEDTTSTKVVVNKSTPQTEERDGYSLVTSGAEW